MSFAIITGTVITLNCNGKVVRHNKLVDTKNCLYTGLQWRKNIHPITRWDCNPLQCKPTPKTKDCPDHIFQLTPPLRPPTSVMSSISFAIPQSSLTLLVTCSNVEPQHHGVSRNTHFTQTGLSWKVSTMARRRNTCNGYECTRTPRRGHQRSLQKKRIGTISSSRQTLLSAALWKRRT